MAITVYQTISLVAASPSPTTKKLTDDDRRCRRFFKGSLFVENSDTRTDGAFYLTLKHKFDNLIAPTAFFPIADGYSRLSSLTNKEAVKI